MANQGGSASNIDGVLILGVGSDGKMHAMKVDETTGAMLSADSAAIGTPADAAWSGSGDATVISLLKKIALNTTP